MADRQLIVVVEGTASMGPFWNSIVSDYLEKIIRSFCGSETTTQKPSITSNSSSTFELALVMFNTHGPYSASLVQRSGWIKDPDSFILWLHSVTFSGGGLNDVATAEGLAEALMMFAIPQNGYQTQQNLEGKRHCILVSGSNPYPLPTPVYQPAIENLEQGQNGDTRNDNHLFDAEAVAKWFGQCSVSLSVICPKPLPKLKTIYHVGKRSQRAADPVVDVKQPHFLVLVSDSFIEACSALSRAGLGPNQSSVTAVPSVSGSSLPAVNGPVVVRPPISNGNAAHATVKIEPVTVTSVTSAPTLPHMPSVPRATAQTMPTLQTSSPPPVSQELSSNNENITDMKPVITMPHNALPNGKILNHISQARVMSSTTLTGGTSLGLPSMGGNPIGMHMSNMISGGMSSTTAPPSQTVTAVAGPGSIPGSSQSVQNAALSSFSSATSNLGGNPNLGVSQPPSNLQGNVNNPVGQSMSVAQSGTSLNPIMSSLGSTVVASGAGSMMPTPGMQSNPTGNMPMSQASTALTPAQSKYVKVWEGNLSGQRQGQPVFITRLEGYRNASASETLAANWPATMQIVRLISQDHMNNKQYVGKADFLVFRAMNQHGFLSQLQEKKLCAVIQLPSQTLLLSVSDKACRLIGMLFPGDMVVFKPQIPSQQQQQQQQQPHSQLQQAAPMNLQQLQQQQPGMQKQLQHLPQQNMQQQPQMQQQLQHLPQQQQQTAMQQLHQQQIPQLQQQQQQQIQLQQQQQQLQLQQQSQPSQMVGSGMGQGYMHRPQLVPQGQVPSQGTPPNMPNGGFMG